MIDTILNIITIPLIILLKLLNPLLLIHPQLITPNPQLHNLRPNSIPTQISILRLNTIQFSNKLGGRPDNLLDLGVGVEVGQGLGLEFYFGFGTPDQVDCVYVAITCQGEDGFVGGELEDQGGWERGLGLEEFQVVGFQEFVDGTQVQLIQPIILRIIIIMRVPQNLLIDPPPRTNPPHIHAPINPLPCPNLIPNFHNLIHNIIILIPIEIILNPNPQLSVNESYFYAVAGGGCTVEELDCEDVFLVDLVQLERGEMELFGEFLEMGWFGVEGVCQPFLYALVGLGCWHCRYHVLLIHIIILKFTRIQIQRQNLNFPTAVLPLLRINKIILFPSQLSPRWQERKHTDNITEGVHEEQTVSVMVYLGQLFLLGGGYGGWGGGGWGWFGDLGEDGEACEFYGEEALLAVFVVFQLQHVRWLNEIFVLQVPDLQTLILSQHEQCETTQWMPSKVIDMIVTALKLQQMQTLNFSFLKFLRIQDQQGNSILAFGGVLVGSGYFDSED